MQFTFAARRSWINAAWQNKASLFGGILAIISLSLAHYAGFLMQVPVHIIAVAGMSLAKGVTATFLFYMFFCAISARVFTSMVQLFALPFWGFMDRLQRGLFRKMTWSQQRSFVRSHTQTIKWEGLVWIAVQAFFFLFLMLGIYVKFTITWASGIGLLISMVLILLSGLVRSGFFLQPKLNSFFRKVKKRPVRSGRAASAVFATFTAALIVGAFFMGGMRASLLRKQEPQMTITKDFIGMATVLASSDGVLLLFQKQGTEFRYIFSSPELTTSVETKQVFSPIGAKKE